MNFILLSGSKPMKYPSNIRKTAILLVAFSFCWIFIGSLILFHEERILGKDFKLQYSVFVAPKSKDETLICKTGPSVQNLKSAGHFSFDSPALKSELKIICLNTQASRWQSPDLSTRLRFTEPTAHLRAPPIL